jgi:membrane peptidoglycan carboxypeptidase
MTGKRWWRRAAAGGVVVGAISTFGFVIASELTTSWLQAALLSSFARRLDFVDAAGPSPRIRFPAGGPYDRRLGYVDLPSFIERLGLRGYGIEAQARLSERHLAAIDRGVFPIYREKTQAGLSLVDRQGQVLFESHFPERIYRDFAAIPALVIDTLLFIENRELLEPGAATRNPAIEWDRLLAVVPGALSQLANPEVKVPGGSTLATQIEKYRHSPDGRTDDIREKFRQLVSASLRSYRDGPDTRAMRREIVVDCPSSE